MAAPAQSVVVQEPTVHLLTTGVWKQNGYVVENGAGQAIVIDPGSEPERFLALLEDRAMTPVAILNTHAHYDHVGAVSPLLERYGAALPFYLSGLDATLLRQANLYRGLFEATEKITVPAHHADLRAVTEGDGRLELPGFAVEVLATPGHTKGSVCFRLGKHFFSGDTLFMAGPGRTDLPGGSATKLRDTIAALAPRCGQGLLLYPGHGAEGSFDAALAAAERRLAPVMVAADGE